MLSPIDQRFAELSNPLYLITMHPDQGVLIQKAQGPTEQPLYSLDQVLAIVEDRLPCGFALHLGGQS